MSINTSIKFLHNLKFHVCNSFRYYQGSGLYSIRSDCYSSTTDFDSCSKSVYSSSSCSHYYDVGLVCDSKFFN